MIVDTFGGPGGWDEALAELGRTDVVGIEWDASACATRRVAGHATIQADVAAYPVEALAAQHVEGLIASPPCPTFSSAGGGAGRDEMPQLHDTADHIAAHGWVDPWKLHPWADPRTPLVLQPLRWVEALRPEWVALEQVPAVLPLWRHYADVWRTLGYDCWVGKLNAADYGVPQTRVRALLIGSRTDKVGRPTATHARHPTPSLFGDELQPWVSMAEALGWTGSNRLGFPRRDDTGDSADGYRERYWREGDEPAFALTEKARSWTVATGVNTMKHTRCIDDVEPYERTVDAPAPSIDTTSVGKWTVGPEGHRQPPHRFKLNPGATESQPNRRRYTPDEVAPTIAFGHDSANWAWESPATTIAGDPRITARCHHDEGSQGRDAKTTEQVRSGEYNGTEPIKLTEVDAALLQSFRPDYPWQGTRTKRFEQIGNAIPPRLARAVLDVAIRGNVAAT